MKKWMWIVLAGVLAGAIWIILRLTRSNGDHALKILDRLKIGLQKKITVINKRQEKREKLIKIMEKYHHEIDKDVKRMSDSELDKYINAFK